MITKSRSQIKSEIVDTLESVGLFTLTQPKVVFVSSPWKDVTMSVVNTHLQNYKDVIALHPIEPIGGFKYVQINIL